MKERIESPRARLLSLQEQEMFVFHGSSNLLDELEPRQAYNLNSQSGKMEKDGAPAVFATPFVDIAIFRSLVNKQGVPEDSKSRFGLRSGSLYFQATQNLLDYSKDKMGMYMFSTRAISVRPLVCNAEARNL